MAEKKTSNYNKYQKDQYQRLAVEKDTHKRIVHHAAKNKRKIKDYIDDIVPPVK